MTAYRGAVASSFIFNNDLVRMRSIRAQLASVCRGGLRTLLQSTPADGRQADELQRQLDELRGRLALCEAKQGAGPDHYDRVRWDMPVAPPPLSQITQARCRAPVSSTLPMGGVTLQAGSRCKCFFPCLPGG